VTGAAFQPRVVLCVAHSMDATMELETLILDTLRKDTARAFTFDEVVSCIAKQLEQRIRETLNGVSDKHAIERLVGGMGRVWRYQAKPIYRR
jgi:hypothetical protein